MGVMSCSGGDAALLRSKRQAQAARDARLRAAERPHCGKVCRKTALAPRTRSPSVDRSYEIFRLDALQQHFDVARLPFSLKVLLENLLRNEGGGSVDRRGRRGARQLGRECAAEQRRSPSRPARVLMQDFTGVPAVVDLAAMRDAMADMGGDPAKINPLAPGRARDRPLCAGRRVRHA